MHLRKIGYWQLGDMASMLTNVPGSRDLVIQKVGTGEVLSCSRGGETCFRIPFWTIPKMSVCDPSSRKQSNQVLVIKQTLLSQVCWLWLEKVCNPTADNASLGYLILKANNPLVSYPTRWSFSFILGPLHWSSIFLTSSEQRNIVQLCTNTNRA